MKTYLNYSQRNQNINNDLLIRKHKCKAEQKNSESIISRENKELNRPARAISFGGSAGLNKISKGVTQVFNSVVEYTSEHEATVKAFTALIVAGMLKPMAVLSMPGSEEKDKQIVATKNFLNAFLGFILSKTITGHIIDKAYEIVDRDLNFIERVNDDNQIELISPYSEKALEIAKKELTGKKSLFFKKAQQTPSIDEIIQKSIELITDFKNNRLSNFQDGERFKFTKLLLDKKATIVKEKGIKSFLIKKTENLKDSNIFKVKQSTKTIRDGYEVFWKNSPDWFTAIAKAKISSLLLPGVMAFLFAKKNLEKQRIASVKNNTLINNSTFKREQTEFQKMLNKNNSQLSFKGKFNSVIASGIENLGNSNFGEKTAKWMAGFNNPFGRMADIESIGITLYWLQDTARSKKIEPSQKLGLNVHSALVTTVSSLAAFVIDEVFNGKIDKSTEKYKKNIRKIIDELRKQENKERFVLDKFVTINDGIPGIEEAVKELPEVESFDCAPIKMAIKDACYEAIADKNAKKSAKQVFDELCETEYIKNLPDKVKGLINEESIAKYIKLLEETAPVKEFIENQSQNLTFSKKIAKELTKINLFDKLQVDKAVEALGKNYNKALSKFKTLTIFTLVVRFLVPVLMVPFSGNLKKKIIEWTGGKANNKK